MARWLVRASVVAAVAASSCRFTDVFKPAGLKDVTVSYLGDSTLIQGVVVPAVAVATVNGVPYAHAQFVLTSSDTTIVSVRGGDSLAARGRGTARLTIALAGTTLPEEGPRIVQALRVVLDTLTLDSARVTFFSIGDTVTLHPTALDANGAPIAGIVPTWTTSDSSVVAVSRAGRLSARDTGTAVVRAILDDDTAAAAVTVTNQVASLTLAPDTAISGSLGDTLAFAAVAKNRRGDAVPGAPITWATPDTAVVQLLGDGRAVTRAVGAARVVATTGAFADTAIAVARNVPVTVRFVLPPGVTTGPVTRSLTAIGDTESPQVVILNARGASLPRNSVTWSVDDGHIVRVTTLGLVTSEDTGRTLVRMASGSLADSAVYVSTNDPASVTIAGLRTDTLTALGQSLEYGTTVLNQRGVPIASYPVAWRSTNRTVVDTVTADTATARGFGSTLLVAQAGTAADTVALTVRHLTRWTVDNGSVVAPRVGSALRPYARIQDAVDAAGAGDSVVVLVGAGAYSETVALSRSLTLLGDSGAFVAGGRKPALLPLIGHDSGAAGVTAYTSAPMTVRYFALRHTLDGPAIDGNGSDLRIEYVYVNPPGSVATRIGRGISIANSLSGSRILRSEVDSVRGYGIKLVNAANAVVAAVAVRGVDSLPGESGAGIAVLASPGDSVRSSVVRRAVVGVLVSGGSLVRVDSTEASTNRIGMTLDGGAVAGGANNAIFDNDSDGVVNPSATNLVIPGNWWGDSLGPRNAGPPAVGDSVVGSVTYLSVRTAPLGLDLAPTALRLVAGNDQTALRNTAVPQVLAVRVVGPGGLPVAGVSVTFTITSGGGRLGNANQGAPLVVTTNGSGLAEAVYRLPNAAGANLITVTGTSVAIGSVTFTELGT